LSYVLEKRHGPRTIVDGKEVVLFSSNDYLALSSHPEVLRAASEAANQYGIGTGGAPGTSGTNRIHCQLSEAIAAFKSREKAVIFPSGYQANLAIHQSLGGSDAIFHVDRRNHPSAIDGARLARDSKIVKFDHNRLEDLESNLKSHSGETNIVSLPTNIVSLPSVFTIDGDIAPLDKLFDLKKKLNFVLILDEAHATGCIGDTGRGLEEHFGLNGAADFIMGTFSKALGSQGGFLAFNRNVEPLLKSQFRSFVFSTSLSAVSAAAALKALQLLESDTTIISSLKESKDAIARKFRELNLEIIKKKSMILLVPCDDCENIQKKLLADGYLAFPVETDTEGHPGKFLRITPNAAHTADDITGFANALSVHLSSD
jgi:7-keto-8-aminopelargonate synthetase-like enzyme